MHLEKGKSHTGNIKRVITVKSLHIGFTIKGIK
jgi:hypothetical protein